VHVTFGKDRFEENPSRNHSKCILATVYNFSSFVKVLLNEETDRGCLSVFPGRFLEDINVDRSLIPDLVDMSVHFHLSVQELAQRYLTEMKRHYYVTPTSYLELISTFKALLQKKQQEVSGLKKR
jgi:predicted nucleotide-binding protein